MKVAIQADSLRALVSTNALITAGLLKVKSAVLAFFRTPLIVAVPLKGANTRMCIEVGGTGAKFTDRWCFGIRHSYLVAVLFFFRFMGPVLYSFKISNSNITDFFNLIQFNKI